MKATRKSRRTAHRTRAVRRSPRYAPAPALTRLHLADRRRSVRPVRRLLRGSRVLRGHAAEADFGRPGPVGLAACPGVHARARVSVRACVRMLLFNARSPSSTKATRTSRRIADTKLWFCRRQRRRPRNATSWPTRTHSISLAPRRHGEMMRWTIHLRCPLARLTCDQVWMASQEGSSCRCRCDSP